jgi:hypothetical protein
MTSIGSVPSSAQSVVGSRLALDATASAEPDQPTTVGGSTDIVRHALTLSA